MGNTVYHMLVLPAEETFPCRQEEFVLDAAQRAGIQTIRWACFGGACGICKARIKKGSYAKVKKMSRAHISPDEEKEGFVLLCCIKPQSDLIIESIND